MPSDCLRQRAAALVAANSDKRAPEFQQSLLEIRGEMNRRGLIPSTINVKEVSKACHAEARARVQSIWEDVKRAHQSCGADLPKTLDADLRSLMQTLAEAEKEKIDAMQEAEVGAVVRRLSNQSLAQSAWIGPSCDSLLEHYRTEIDIYVDTLRRQQASSFLDKLKTGLSNNKLVAFAIVVLLTVAGLAAFADNLLKLNQAARAFLGLG